MNDQRKTKAQLIAELRQTRQSLAQLAAAEAARSESEQRFRVAHDLSLDAFTLLGAFATLKDRSSILNGPTLILRRAAFSNGCPKT